MPESDKHFLEKMKQKVELELREREIRAVEYWLAEVTKLQEKRHQQISAIQTDLHSLISKMKNRIAALKKGDY
ncbi:MAG: hypothetical protein V1736_04815 [Pseudomonadota bacterium]